MRNVIAILFILFSSNIEEDNVDSNNNESIVLREFKINDNLFVTLDSIFQTDLMISLEPDEHYLLTSSRFQTLDFIQKDTDPKLDFYTLKKELSFN